MAATGTPTTNIGLRRPQGTDPASVDDINYNSELIDTKLGAVGDTSLQAQVTALNSNIAKIGNYTSAFATPGNNVTFAPPKDAGIIVFKMPTTATTANTAFGYYVKQNGYLLFAMVTNHSSITVTTNGGNMTLATTNNNGAQAICIGTAIS